MKKCFSFVSLLVFTGILLPTTASTQEGQTAPRHYAKTIHMLWANNKYVDVTVEESKQGNAQFRVYFGGGRQSIITNSIDHISHFQFRYRIISTLGDVPTNGKDGAVFHHFDTFNGHKHTSRTLNTINDEKSQVVALVRHAKDAPDDGLWWYLPNEKEIKRTDR